MLGALQQLEEVASLWIKYRMGEMPFRFLVLKDDTSDMGYFLHGTLKGVAGLGLLFTVPPLAGALGALARVCVSWVGCHPSVSGFTTIIAHKSTRTHTANIYGDNGLYFWFRYYHAEVRFFLFLFLVLSPPVQASSTYMALIILPPTPTTPTPPSPHPQFYALYWFALLVCLQCAVNFARVSRVSAHRRRRARRHVRHGDYYRRMTFETAAFLTAAGALWLVSICARACVVPVFPALVPYGCSSPPPAFLIIDHTTTP